MVQGQSFCVWKGRKIIKRKHTARSGRHGIRYREFILERTLMAKQSEREKVLPTATRRKKVDSDNGVSHPLCVPSKQSCASMAYVVAVREIVKEKKENFKIPE
jgi:hypothetical protein